MTKTFNELSDAMAAAVEAAEPSLVSVHGRRRLPATGIVWSKEGIIVTAHHTLERDDNIHVVAGDSESKEATLVGRDPQNDLAVLKVDIELTPANWGQNEALKVGNLVLALGRPGTQVQATLGVVSALHSGTRARGQEHRHRRKGRGRRIVPVLVDGYIQTDVVMYPGFSGGALISGDGMVHGLITSGFGHGSSIAVPVTTIRNSITTLQKHGKMKQGYLGVGVQPVQLPERVAGELEQESGLLIISVESGSPAADAGLLVGDIIVSLAGEQTGHTEELLSLLSGERVGQAVPIAIVRGGELKQMTVTIGERQ